MYLARKRSNRKICYVLRESVFDSGMYKSRDLLELGDDPGDYIIYPDDGPAFYFDDRLWEALNARGVQPDNDTLENVFRPFLDPETRRILEQFRRPATGRREWLKNQKERCRTAAFHPFDKRRLHYLRFGEVDQSRLDRVPPKIYRKLLDKSRDEIEQQFQQMETVLQAHEKKTYAYVIFHVAGCFSSPIARQFPQALPQEKVDACFLDAVCRLNADGAFWADLPRRDNLHEYLIRYVCWFFDSDFAGATYLEDLFWQFKRRHHGYRPPPRREEMPADEAMQILDIDKKELATLTIKTLTRRYRRMAKKHHPDRGGQHETFIRLNRAFEELLRKIRGQSAFPKK